AVEVLTKDTPALNVKALVDRLVRYLHVSILRVETFEDVGDQLRAPPVVHVVLNELDQFRAGQQLEPFGPLELLLGVALGPSGVIDAVLVQVAVPLTADHA